MNSLPFTDSASTIVNGLGAGSLAISGSGCGSGLSGVGTGAPEAVYRYTPTVSGSYAFTLNPSFDAVVWVFEYCTNPTSTCEVAGKVAAGQTGAVGTYLLSGDPVFIVVDGLFGDDASGSYTLTVEKKCLPNCDGKSCGTDGCGGSCGTCTSPDQCTQGKCETPTATAICLAGEVVGELPWETTGSWWSQSSAVLTVPPSCSGGTVTGGNGKERVLQFTAPYTGRFQVSFTVPGMSGTVALYAVKDCTKVGSTCLDGTVGGGFSRIYFDLVAGEKTFIILDETSDATEFSGEYTLSIDGCTADCAGVGCGLESGCADYCGGCSGSNLCGTNGQCTASQVGESCQDPRVIPSVPYSVSSDTTGAGNDIDFTVCIADLGTMLGKTDGAADHVYAFTPAQSGKYEAKLTVGTGFEYLAYLVKDCADIAYSCAKKANGQCGDAVGGCSQSLETTMLAGETWYLVVDGYTASESGGYFLDVDATCLEQCGNKECGPDTCIGSCGTCAPGTLCSAEGMCDATWHLAINEIDYNQTGTDTLEFIEIVNPTSVEAPLAGIVVETINGDNDDVLNSYALSNAGTTLAPGARLVIGMAAVQASLPAGTAFISASSGFLQNGGTFGDAIRIRKGLTTIDAVSWDAPVTGATEGDDAGTDDGAGTLSRCPDGKDTNDNAADFVLSATATAGKTNSCP